MSKAVARSRKSYDNEDLVKDLLPLVLQAKGFSAVEFSIQGNMKFVHARRPDGAAVMFWLKQGWTDTLRYSAIQFGMLRTTAAANLPDDDFEQHVAARVQSAKARGATHALMVHMIAGEISNYVVLAIDDVALAYRRQLEGWPRRARNAKMPTLHFEDTRNVPDAACVSVVLELDIALERLSGFADVAGAPQAPAWRKITADIVVRMRQQHFRLAVGERFGWTCPLSNTRIREVLDAAHLPGRDWRIHNGAEDGVLLRADLHRLLDSRLAEIRDGRFWVKEEAREGDYAAFHDRPLLPRS